MAPNFRVADPPPAAPPNPIPLYCLSTIWASHIEVLRGACCTASEIFRDTNTNTARWGEWHLYGVLTPCKSLRRLSLGTGEAWTAIACQGLGFLPHFFDHFLIFLDFSLKFSRVPARCHQVRVRLGLLQPARVSWPLSDFTQAGNELPHG